MSVRPYKFASGKESEKTFFSTRHTTFNFLSDIAFFYYSRTLYRVLEAVCLRHFLIIIIIRAPSLSRLTDLDAIWQLHLHGQMTRGFRCGFLTRRGRGDFRSMKPPAKTCSCFQLTKTIFYVSHSCNGGRFE